MKRLSFMALVLSAASSLHAHGLGFFTDPQQAVAHAMVNDSPLLVFFTGSDWCPLTHEMDVKVWDDSTLAAHLNRNYPMLNADYPQRAKLKPEHRKQLRNLAEKYNIRHFPTMLALTYEMAEIGRLEYRGESAAEVAQKLEEWEVRYAQLGSAPEVPLSLPETPAKPRAAPTSSGELRPGDILPDLSFTGSDGKPIELSKFQGKALLFTFVFTRCPLPDYCPLQSWKFSQMQKLLSEDATAPANWHLLSISIDPKRDVPEVLARYAAMHGAKPQHWSFATGELAPINTLALQLGADFWADKDGLITHHMRTVLVGTDGRIRRIITDSKWSPEDLAAEIKKLAAPSSGPAGN